jgi:hypothetical protein
MAITNRYFILPYPNVNSGLWDIIVQTPTSLRTNLIGSKCIVKLPVGDTQDHPLLNGFTEYDHAGILQYLIDNEEDWNETIG